MSRVAYLSALIETSSFKGYCYVASECSIQPFESGLSISGVWFSLLSNFFWPIYQLYPNCNLPKRVFLYFLDSSSSFIVDIFIMEEYLQSILRFVKAWKMTHISIWSKAVRKFMIVIISGLEAWLFVDRQHIRIWSQIDRMVNILQDFFYILLHMILLNSLCRLG